MSKLRGSIALVTGGASGIGRLMAKKMSARGATVVIWDIDQSRLESTLAELRSTEGVRTEGFVCDVSDREQIYDCANRVREQVGNVDILVNNAGVVSGKFFLDMPDEKIENTFKVNSLSLFWTARAFLPSMIERNSGHVVTVASAAGLIGVSGLGDYASSKFAAVGFDESLRVELKKRAPGVYTTVVCPFFIDTGMFDGVKTRFPLILPILKEDKVAEAIVQAIRRNRPRLFMPPIVYTVPMLRALPPWAFDSISNALGINISMQEFKGRGSTQEP